MLVGVHISLTLQHNGGNNRSGHAIIFLKSNHDRNLSTVDLNNKNGRRYLTINIKAVT